MKFKLAIILCAATITLGCVQMPTTTSSTVDNRPQITFKVNDSFDLAGLHVLIDGLDNGPIEPYTNSTKALRILPGTHIIAIVDGDTVISSQKIFVSDGMTKEVVFK